MEFRKLKADEIDCRVSQIASNYCTLLLYKDARVDMNILDETVGSLNWQRTHQVINGNLFCTIEIWDEEKGEWVKKQDVGTESMTEKEKGESSDSFKRAGFCVGIGRELYTAPNIFIFPNKDMGIRGKDEFYLNDKEKYETKTRFWVEYIDYDDNKIQNLIIRDNKNNIRFTQLTKDKEKELADLDKKLVDAIEKKEEKDARFNRDKFYEYFKAESTLNMTIEQKQQALEMLGGNNE